MKIKKRNVVYNKRIIIMFALICAAFAILLIRIAFIQNSSVSYVSEQQAERKITVGSTRGNIYDRNYKLLVNTVKENNIALLTSEQTKELVEQAGILPSQSDTAAEGLLIIKKYDKKIENSLFAKNIETYKRYSENQLCTHVIGYLNSEQKGVCGIEKAFDTVLSAASGEAWIKYRVDAKGRIIAGDGIQEGYDNYFSKAGVVLSIDRDIQEITEKAMRDSDIICGAAIVMSVKTGEILAMLSLPEYDVNDIAASLNDENLPFLNRCLSAYPVGSVFKPFIAAAAMKSGLNLDEIYSCEGYFAVGTQIFKCFNSRVHGEMALRGAISNSCNAYFIDLGIKTGKENILGVCSEFGFGKSIELCPSLTADAGNLPDKDSILSTAQLANLCFGQGELLATPLQLAAAYSVFANKGKYIEPYILKELMDSSGEIYGYYKQENEYKLLDESYCDKINEALFTNMLEGTGVNGQPGNTSACGKTATAQTGRYDENGNEQLCTWFAGFFPYENPEYTVIVFNEKGSTASLDCAPVFQIIAQEITALRDAQGVS